MQAHALSDDGRVIIINPGATSRCVACYETAIAKRKKSGFKSCRLTFQEIKRRIKVREMNNCQALSYSCIRFCE